MSKTEKVHTHKSPGVRYMEASSRAKSKARRAAIKSEMKNISDPEDFDFTLESKRCYVPGRSGSVTYLDPTVSEAEYLKAILSVKNAIANETIPWDPFSAADKALHKDILNRAKLKDPTFKGNRYQAMLLLSNEELAECIHRFYASKGLKKTKC